MEWGENMVEETRSNKEHSAQNSIISIKTLSVVILPPPPAKDEGYWPVAGSTRRVSHRTTVSQNQGAIKYGKEKHAWIELTPQPSDDPADPLNWSRWKKETNYVALLFVAVLIAAMKTAFVSTNAVMTVRYGRSYSAVIALTAIPLCLSSVTGMASLVASKIWGKRPVYLASFILIFIGTLVNMRMLDNYGGCMAGRVFQGLGWGAFDVLMLGSIQDIFFEHERRLRISIYNVFTTAVMWGGPLFGGLASRNAQRFTFQFEIINSFYFVAIPLLFLGMGETTFDRRWSITAPTPAPSYNTMFGTLRPYGQLRMPTKDDIKAYLKSVPLHDYKGMADQRTLLQAPKAFLAPTTFILFLTTFLPYCSLWALSESLSLMFAPPPFSLNESSIGNILAGAFALSVLVLTGFGLYKEWSENFTMQVNILTICSGSFLAATALLTFGLKWHNILHEIPVREDDVSDEEFDRNIAIFVSTNVTPPLIGILLGILAAGSKVLDATIAPLILRSTRFTGSNPNVCLENMADMTAGVHIWRALFAGVFVQAIPSAFEASNSAFKRYAIGLGITQLLVAAGIAVAWWFYDDNIRRKDGRVMVLVESSILKRSISFFNHD